MSAINDLLHLVQKNFTTVEVSFEDNQQIGKTYVYKILFSLKLEVGDLVVVPVNSLFSYKTAIVKEIHSSPKLKRADYDYKWVVSKVDLSNYLAQLDLETRFKEQLEEAERAARLQTILNEMRSRFGEGAVREKFESTLREVETFGADPSGLLTHANQAGSSN